MNLAFSLSAGKQPPAGASGVKFPGGWEQRDGGGRSRGAGSCRTPAPPAGTDPRGALPASSSSRARGEAPVEVEPGAGEHWQKSNKPRSGPNVGHKSRESG